MHDPPLALPMKVGRLLLCGVLLCAAAALFVLLRRGVSGSYIAGRVVDSGTGRPVPGALVAVHNRGWGLVNGGLVWDKDYVDQAITDAAGRFRVAYRVGSSAQVIATKKGYQPYDGWQGRNSTGTIGLKRRDAHYRPLPHGLLELGVRTARAYGWVFSTGRTTAVRADADVYPEVGRPYGGLAGGLTLHAPGGITFVASTAPGAQSDPLAYAESAPVRGYQPALSLDPDRRGVYYLRTRDGRYAMVAWSATTVGAAAELRQGTWGVLLEYVYNPRGDRGLALER